MLVPQIKYLYYPLNVEGFTQKDSLLPAQVIIRLQNRLHTYEKTDGNEDKQMDTKTKKIFKNQDCCQCWSPRYRISVLSTNCGGCHPKGVIVASSYKIRKNNNNINFNVPVPILLFTRQEKKIN